ncbi:hypothetical protein ACIRPP_04800 [Streptomyces sp. NPDC101219]|uniref:hypothetical protein n=1 Tax=Streptomyces sp. NPDC101219 TaxID=3366131 RepID=UPI00382ED864
MPDATAGVTAAAAVLALPLCLLLASRGGWVVAGAVLGAAVAREPLLAPAVLLFVFAHRWRALGALLLVHTALLLPGPPALLSGGLPSPSGLWGSSAPFASFALLDPSAFPDPSALLDPFGPYPALPAGAAEVWPAPGLPPTAAWGLTLLVAAAGVVCAHRRWHGPGPVGLRLVETATGLMLSAFLVLRPSLRDHLLVLGPLLLAGLPYAGSAARRPWFWLALVPQLPGLTLPGPRPGRRRARGRAVAWCALRAAGARRCPPPGDGVPVRTRPGRRTVGVPAWGAGAGAARPTGPGPVLTRPAEDG